MIPEAPAFPDILDYLWRFYGEVSLGIASNGMGPAQITWRDVAAWTWLTGNVLEPWEARCLVQLGLVRASVVSETLQRQQS